MLKKRQRLSRREFKILLLHGRRVHAKNVTLVYGPGQETKAGLVVSKKTAKNATKRNLIRRRVYSIIERHINFIKNTHLAILLKPSAAELSYTALSGDIEEVLKNFK